MADPSIIIQATLAPIFLTSGAAIFLNFTQARLFRVVDRLRGIGTSLKTEEDPAERRELLASRTRNLRRAVILRNAILFGVLVIAFTVLTAFLILTPSVLARTLSNGPIISFGLSLASFAVALVLVTLDAFLSVAAARHASREFHEGIRPGEDDDDER